MAKRKIKKKKSYLLVDVQMDFCKPTTVDVIINGENFIGHLMDKDGKIIQDFTS